jgi:hypothetical protein
MNFILYSGFSQERIEMLAHDRIFPQRRAILLDHLAAELRVAVDPSLQASPS